MEVTLYYQAFGGGQRSAWTGLGLYTIYQNQLHWIRPHDLQGCASVIWSEQFDPLHFTLTISLSLLSYIGSRSGVCAGAYAVVSEAVSLSEQQEAEQARDNGLGQSEEQQGRLQTSAHFL